MPKTRPLSTMIARTAAYAVALVMLGWATQAASENADKGAVGATHAREAAPVQTANLLVPKRTRIVIKFERTAVC